MPLRHRDFRLLWSGQVCNGVGAWVYHVTASWLLYELTNSPFMLGLNGVSMAVATISSLFVGGALSDRMDRRKLLLICQGVSVCLVLVPVTLSATKLIQVWHIFTMNFLIHAVSALEAPARQALVPGLVPRAELMRAVAFTSVVRRGTALIGPMIGGYAINFAGASGAFFLYAAILATAFLNTLLMRAPKTEHVARTVSMAHSILDGLTYVKNNAFLFAVFSVEAMTMLFAMYVQILPVFARDVLHVGPKGLGLLYSAPGVGALIASTVMVTIGDVKKKGRLFVWSALAKPVAAGIFAVSTWMPLSFAMLGFVGLLDVIGGTVRTTILQLVTNEQMRGRMMSIDMMTHRGLGTLNGLPLGGAASLIGAPLALLGGAVMVSVYAVTTFLRVPVHRYSEGPTMPERVPARTEQPGAGQEKVGWG